MALQRDREFNEQYKGQQIKNITPVYCNANLLMRHISSVQLSIRSWTGLEWTWHRIIWATTGQPIRAEYEEAQPITFTIKFNRIHWNDMSMLQIHLYMLSNSNVIFNFASFENNNDANKKINILVLRSLCFWYKR